MPLKNSFQRSASLIYWPKKQQKRREFLSVNMISLPLGDFRHLAHIGGQACHDSFGDLSFLKKGHGLLGHSSQSEQDLFLACSPPPKPPRLNIEEPDPQTSPTWEDERHSSQRHKKCTSMPLLDCAEVPGPAPEVDSGRAGRRGFGSNRDADYLQTCLEELQLEDEDDCAFTLDLDLGPSILDDVLQVMNKQHQGKSQLPTLFTTTSV